MSGRWIGLRMDYLGSLIAFVTAAMTMLLRKQLDPATQGEILDYHCFFLMHFRVGNLIIISNGQ
jgi:hypothetical protein